MRLMENFQYFKIVIITYYLINVSVQEVKECVETTTGMWLSRSECMIDDRNVDHFLKIWIRNSIFEFIVQGWCKPCWWLVDCGHRY